LFSCTFDLCYTRSRESRAILKLVFRNNLTVSVSLHVCKLNRQLAETWPTTWQTRMGLYRQGKSCRSVAPRFGSSVSRMPTSLYENITHNLSPLLNLTAFEIVLYPKHKTTDQLRQTSFCACKINIIVYSRIDISSRTYTDDSS